jgi:hypothetical protein
MSEIRKPNGELRGYIFWEGRWCHVYIISGFDQMVLVGEPVKMFEFKLSKNAKTTHAAERIKFHKKRPSTGSTKRGGQNIA